MKLKYIIFDDSYPCIIGECNKHSDVHGMGHPTSAGFCSIREVADDSPHAISLRKIEVHCWGESSSLGVKSNHEHDSKILERLFLV